ncbi:putative uncharacterized protein [Phocaeicola plebeius CAG:211]|uniref:Uncharacterized protein n=1 Tax=Phocaeicola plebeius CAG:211 TaxID=1263052 RepID=R5W2U4_9BACT|nr:putative uncharacterized protein [Phocaeicola plebeius CAG:211]
MHTTINTTQNNILVTDAAIDEQRIRLQNAQTDYKRYQELLKEEAVTPPAIRPGKNGLRSDTGTL